MKHSMVKFGAALALMLAALTGAAFAASAIVENAKSQCIVGEQADGYLGYVDASRASDELRREVRAINQQRKAYYADLAEKNNVSIDAIATITAEKLIRQASAGECVKDSTGEWKKK